MGQPNQIRRRAFLSSVATGSMALAMPARDTGAAERAAPGRQPGHQAGGTRSNQPILPATARRLDLKGSISKIGKWSLEDLVSFYRKQLREDVIGFWQACGIDREHGGYLRPDKKTRSYAVTDKDLYSQGRLLWLFSFLYNHFGRDPEHLEAARQGRQALLEHGRVAGGHWGTLYTRDWKLKQGFFDIYADIYMVLGLQEYFKASGDEQAKEQARETAYAVTKVILSPEYLGAGHGPAYEPGIKRLGTWVHLLFALNQLLSHFPDEGLERIARFCVRNILTRHWQREKGFAWECLDHQYQPFAGDYLSDWAADYDWAHQILGWHTVQGAYKVMLEGLRLGNRSMFVDGMELGFQTLRAHWSDAEPGGPQEFAGVDQLNRRRGKAEPDAAIYDYLLFALFAIEHTLAPEAVAWFGRMHSAVLKRPEGIFTGSLTLHEPRGVMLAIQILERLIQRHGKASGFLAGARNL